jgi:hypothetical protein
MSARLSQSLFCLARRWPCKPASFTSGAISQRTRTSSPAALFAPWTALPATATTRNGPRWLEPFTVAALSTLTAGFGAGGLSEPVRRRGQLPRVHILRRHVSARRTHCGRPMPGRVAGWRCARSALVFHRPLGFGKYVIRRKPRCRHRRRRFTGLGNLNPGETLDYAFDGTLASTSPAPEPDNLISLALGLLLCAVTSLRSKK